MRTLTELKYEPEMVKVDDLSISEYNARYNRSNHWLVEQLKESIATRGYDENFPLTVGYVIGSNNSPEVLGGGHRFLACKELNIKEVPANVYRDLSIEDAITISISTNENQKTFAPETFIDRAYQIHRLLENGGKKRSQAEVGAMMGISQTNVGYYDAIIKDLDPEVLKIVENTFTTQESEKAVENEKGGVVKNTTQAVKWQLKWFRYITPLQPKYQRQIVEKIISNSNQMTTEIVRKYSEVYKARQELEAYFTERIPQEFLDEYITNLSTGAYDGQISYDKSQKKYNINQSLIDTIEQLRQQSSSRFENIDCLQMIPTLQDKSIDCLITDPPYGIDYKSNRRQDKTDDVNVPIKGDTPEESLSLLSDCLSLLDNKMKDDSHCYIFCSWKMYPEVKTIVERHFKIKNLLIWNKNNHGSGDLESYAPKYECIIFGTKGQKGLIGKRIADVIDCAKVDKERKHPTEKPIELLKTLLSHSCSKGEIIIDPFAGVGSSLVAAKELGLGYIGCEINSQYKSIGDIRLKGIEAVE